MGTSASPRELVQSLSGRHLELVRFLRMRLPNQDDARDLAQEAYLRLLRLSDNHYIRHPEAYLFRIAANLVHEYWLAARSDSIDAASEPDDTASNTLSPEVLAGQQQALDHLKRAIQFLPQIQQAVIVLHRRDGKTYKEIAVELGISRDMVKKHLSKALARCRQYLKLRKHEY